MARRESALGPLTVDAIVEAALRIADDEGFAALSMRKVATVLACAPMSLYEHVANKDALLDLMADQAMSALPEVDPAGDWRSEMTRFFTEFHDLLLRHPGVAETIVKRPLAGPVAALYGERALTLLVEAGLADKQAVELFVALTGYTIGASLYDVTLRAAPQVDQRLRAVTDADHPTLRRLAPLLTEHTGDDRFRAGLTRLLSEL